MEKFTVTCADGVPLKGILLLPESPKAMVQFNVGTASKKEFYLPFLEYLAENGYASCLWDYRGSGESAPENMRKCDFTFRDYGMKDMPAIKEFLQKRFPDLPLFFFGHSSGGQQVGMMPDLEGVKGMVGFAVSTGYLPHMPLGYRLQSAYFFFLFSPVSFLLTGYLRAKKFGIMEDLPKNVVKEWRRWCLRPTYLFDQKFFGKTVPTGHYAGMPFPIHIIWTPDDPISNERSVPSFWKNVHSEKGISFTKIDPKAVGNGEIGHFGFFKKKFRETLWPLGLAKLDEFLAGKGN
ncbi:MAG: alpha/beta fold hydrolase [Bacteroidia bacterium]|nr:alpha/beta fold hydrolase [Bacteroidia bacterium]